VWEVSNPAVLSIDQATGRAKALDKGTVVVQVKPQGNDAGATQLVIEVVGEADVPVKEIKITPESHQMAVGDSVTLRAQVFLPDGQINGNVLWASSDTTIATINSSNGTVTALKPGRVTLVAAYAAVPSFKGLSDIVIHATPAEIPPSPKPVPPTHEADRTRNPVPDADALKTEVRPQTPTLATARPADTPAPTFNFAPTPARGGSSGGSGGSGSSGSGGSSSGASGSSAALPSATPTPQVAPSDDKDPVLQSVWASRMAGEAFRIQLEFDEPLAILNPDGSLSDVHPSVFELNNYSFAFGRERGKTSGFKLDGGNLVQADLVASKTESGTMTAVLNRSTNVTFGAMIVETALRFGADRIVTTNIGNGVALTAGEVGINVATENPKLVYIWFGKGASLFVGLKEIKARVVSVSDPAGNSIALTDADANVRTGSID
jgi:hypothetical protein